MIFSIATIVLVAIVAYFHYTQGVFSATLSAILAAVAGVFAIAYHETLAATLLRGRAAGYLLPMVLVVLFAALYLIPRILFDRFVPGNVRVPVAMDKVGAGLMGLVAGFFAVAVVAVAAQELPFGPDIAGYSRYPLALRAIVTRQPGRQALDTEIPEELKVPRLEPDKAQHLILPVDDWLMATVAHLSDGGSLAGAVPLQEAQPQYLDTLFGQRLGVQLGAKTTVLNLGAIQQVTVPKEGVAVEADLPQVEGALPEVRPSDKLPATARPGPGNAFLVVRTIFGFEASDPDNLLRLSPASARVVVGGKNYFAVGSLQDARVLVRNDAGDPMFIPFPPQQAGEADGRGIDLVFEVPKADLLAGGGSPKVAEGVFLEVKRWARVDLSGRPALPSLAPAATVDVLRPFTTMDAIRKPAA